MAVAGSSDIESGNGQQAIAAELSGLRDQLVHAYPDPDGQSNIDPHADPVAYAFAVAHADQFADTNLHSIADENTNTDADLSY